MFGLSLTSIAWKALAVMAVVAVAFATGWRVDNWRWEAKQVAAQAQVQAEKDALVKKANDAEAALLAARNSQRVVYRDITKQVEKVVTRTQYRNVCLDADGLSLANSALANEAPTTAQPH